MTKDDDIIDLLKEFKTYDFIAKELGVSKSRIANTKRLYYIKKSYDDTNLVPKIVPLGQKVSEYISKEKAVFQGVNSKKSLFSFTLDDIDFLKVLIIKSTHRRVISQIESLKAINILFNIKGGVFS